MNVKTHSDAAPQRGVRHIIIDPEYAGQRVDNYLQRELKGVPKSRIYRIIRKGEVRVNGKRVRPSTRLLADDKLRIPPIRTAAPGQLTSPVKDILKTILYENNVMLIINKPSGIAVHGGSGISMGVIESMRAALPNEHNLELVHRLDRDTSGCLMISKNRSHLRSLQRALREKTGIGKYYRAIVHGQWSRRKTLIDAPITKNILRSGERVSRVAADGKPSTTGFTVIGGNDGFCLVEARAFTGRTHQIRVHCRHAGLPIVGDVKYGFQDADKIVRQRFGYQRLMLHA
ncbi:MAG TPA: 23S rRNA pseudouridine(955/2504/2580) synthase, partial [Gammaproteobacteria bacterium]|nr:23S rRNA pseudouridine(955/2504/2580) synthase [Gammaproteobacteria bacterium]